MLVVVKYVVKKILPHFWRTFNGDKSGVSQINRGVHNISGSRTVLVFQLPNVAPYQLGYTRIQDIKFYQMWSNMWSEEFYHKFSELSRRESGDICGETGAFPIFRKGWRSRSLSTQTRRPTNWATPGNNNDYFSLTYGRSQGKKAEACNGYGQYAIILPKR